jgi:hypothetical protein
MKKISIFLLFSLLIITSCNNKEPIDSRDEFLGTYVGTLSQDCIDSFGTVYDFDDTAVMTVSKGTNSNELVLSIGGAQILATLSGSSFQYASGSGFFTNNKISASEVVYETDLTCHNTFNGTK